jgi:carbon monoxide dehydrogenase subunit G
MAMTQTASRAGALLIAACIGATQGFPSTAAAEDIQVETTRDGEFVTVAASAELPPDRRVAWEVLSDYDHLAQFIPDIDSSRVVSRDGNRLVVEQKGAIWFFFYRQPVEVTFSVLEEPTHRISARATGGNVRELETRYELQSDGAGLRLAYTGRFIPSFRVPPLIGMPVIRHVLERRFRAMVEEIQRRAALAKGASKP